MMSTGVRDSGILPYNAEIPGDLSIRARRRGPLVRSSGARRRAVSLEDTAQRADAVHEGALARLVSCGIVERQDYLLLERLPSSRYTII